MRRFLMLLMATALIGAVSCTSDDEVDNGGVQQPPKPTITLDSTTSDFTAEGGSAVVSFTSSGAWTAEVINSRADSWCSIEPTSGSAGEAAITITTTPNETPDDRTASVIIKTGTVSKSVIVSQKQKDALTVTASRFELSAEGGEVKIEVKANVDFEYIVEKSAEDWIIYEGTRALKSSNLTFRVASNEETAKREGVITIRSGSLSEQVTIYQEGEKPTIVLSKSEYIVSAAGETIAVEVKSNVDVSVEIQADLDWISENTTRALSTNTYRFDIAENLSYDQRTAQILFTNKANNLTEKVTVVQSQKDAIVLAKSEYELGFDGGRLDFEIQANVEVSAAISDNAKEWILPVGTRALKPQELSFDILPNYSEESREGTITLTGGNAKQTITIKQSGIESINPEDVPDNEIWYTKNTGKYADIIDFILPEVDANIVEHLYEQGKWVIRCDKTITKFSWGEHETGGYDDGSILTGIYLPNSVEYIAELPRASSYIDIKEFHVPKNLKIVTGGGLIFYRNLERFSGYNISEDGRCIIIDGKLCAFASLGLEEYFIPDNVKIIQKGSFQFSPLKKITIPQGVSTIEEDAFYENDELEHIYLPSSLKKIGIYAFSHCGKIKKFDGDCEFISDDGYSLIFDNYANTGNKFIVSFASGAGLSSYEIPEGVVGIENYCFYHAESLSSITFPHTIQEIGIEAFSGSYNIEEVRGEYVLDDNRSLVVNEKLLYVAPKGLKEYTTPIGVKQLGYGVLKEKPELEKVIISDEVVGVDLYGYLMSGNPNLKEVTISARMQYLGYGPFDDCPKLETIYCRATIPPVLLHHNGPWLTDVFTIYVPRESLSAYLNSPYWQEDLMYIKPYDYTDLPEVDYYVSSDYSQDGKVTALQRATVGEGIDVVLMGDGYSDRQIADGTYRSVMERAYNNLFTEEPYRSHKEYFNVYYVNAVSATEGYDYSNTAFAGFFGDGTLVGGDDNAVFTYAQKAISAERMDEALLVVMMNSENFGGTCYMYYPTSGDAYGSGVSVSYFPVGADEETFAQLLHHEANGHGFPKLADEYAYEELGAFPSDQVATYQEQQSGWGWWQNVDFTSDANAVLWAKFLDDSRYANEGLGCFEGGLTYWSGVWRPTDNSIMRYNTGGFNAPSREAIYKRIHHLAYGESWEYDYEEFVAWDAINRTEAATAARRAAAVRAQKGSGVRQMPAPPVVVGHSWREAK